MKDHEELRDKQTVEVVAALATATRHLINTYHQRRRQQQKQQRVYVFA